MNTFAFDPSTPGRIYAAALSGVLYRSDDSGSTWSRVQNLPRLSINALLMDRTASSTIYMGTNLGIFISTDGGASGRQSTLTSDTSSRERPARSVADLRRRFDGNVSLDGRRKQVGPDRPGARQLARRTPADRGGLRFYGRRHGTLVEQRRDLGAHARAEVQSDNPRRHARSLFWRASPKVELALQTKD